MAAATCFDLIVHSIIAQEEVTSCRESWLCNCMCVFFRAVMGLKETRVLLGLQGHLDFQGPLDCLAPLVLLDRYDWYRQGGKVLE